jgi:hypothetical protein
MERLISWKNTLPLIIGRRPPMPFAIANNLLAPSTKAINLKISPQATASTTWNNYENPKDGPLLWNISKDAHIPSQKTHLKTNGEQRLRLGQIMCSNWKSNIGGETKFEGGGYSWCKATMVPLEGIASVMGWKALAALLYSSALFKVRHWWKQVVEEFSHEWWKWGAQKACEDSSWKKD